MRGDTTSVNPLADIDGAASLETMTTLRETSPIEWLTLDDGVHACRRSLFPGIELGRPRREKFNAMLFVSIQCDVVCFIGLFTGLQEKWSTRDYGVVYEGIYCDVGTRLLISFCAKNQYCFSLIPI